MQPSVPNIPLQLSKNLQFTDSNSILVTQLLAIGIPSDSPTTGYISRIGAVLSTQIDQYNTLVTTISNQQTAITNLQAAVAGLEISGNTIPNVNGYCFTGGAKSPITTVTELIAQSACDYNSVLGTPSALSESVLAENPSVLNVEPAFSQNSDMAGLTGWITSPETISDAVNNLWLSYIDSRTGISTALKAVTTTCQQVVIDFFPVYSNAAGGFNIYFSGYSNIPSGYTDNGSSITISDGLGGIVTKGINITQLSQPGAGSLFIAISGTPLVVSQTAYNYTVQVNSVLTNGTNTCSKSVIHSTGPQNLPQGEYVGGSYQTSGITSSPPVQTFTIASNLPFKPFFVSVMALDSSTALALSTGYYITPTNTGATLTLVNITGTESLNINWIAYPSGTTRLPS